jgi:probable rRNA maturation factor
LSQIVAIHQGSILSINFIFCDDEYLLSLNKTHLQHDTLTDIITFRYQEHPLPLESDIYISVDRVKENACQYNVSFENELNRVMAHGLFHLLGYKDKTTAEAKIMREKEDEALALWLAI